MMCVVSVMMYTLYTVCVTIHTIYTPPGGDLYCSPCRLYEPTYRSSPHIPLEEVMWKAEEEVYSDNLLLLGRLCVFRIFENYCPHSFQPEI